MSTFIRKGLLNTTGGGTGGYSIATLDDMFNEMEKEKSNRIIRESDDSLAVSCVRYRNTELGTRDFKIHDSDYNTANNIREYYSKKLMVRTLKGKPVSQFRQDLMEYLSKGYTNEYPEKFVGMIYKLPEFYFYDLELDKMRMESSNTSLDTFIGVKKLKFLNKLNWGNKSTGYFQFYFHDEAKNLYSLQIHKENELLGVFESLCNLDVLHINGKFVSASRDELNYRKICNPKLLFEQD